MSTALDVRAKNTAYRLIAKYGKSMTLTETTRGAKNFDTGVTASGTATEYSIKGAIMEYTSREIDGKTVKFGDKKILTYAKDLPTTLDSSAYLYTLTISSAVWNVVTINPGYSGEDIAYYELQVRQ